MEFLLNPNVVYTLLAGGLVLAILALFAPGTGLLEIGAVLALFLAGYGLLNLNVNGWALILALLGIIPLVLAVRSKNGRRTQLLLGLGILALVIGSVFVIRAPAGGTAVNPILAIVISGSSAVLLWFMARKSLEAQFRKPSHSLADLVGAEGVVRTAIKHGEGTVYIGSEEWSAACSVDLPAGTPVRVTARRGLSIEVEKL